MAWMSDEKYELMQDTRDKAITARSAHNTRTHCGKGGSVKFPSDNLTKKEREAMNSECKSYRMNDPMTYDEFKDMPDDLKELYLNAIVRKYDAPLTVISKAMGMQESTLSWLIRTHKLKIHSNRHRGRAAWDKTGFYNWWNGVKTDEKPKYVPLNDSDSKDYLTAVNEDAEIKSYVENDVAVVEEVAQECKEYSVVNNCSVVNNPTPVDICTNPYHHMPVIPKNGTMTFVNNRAEDALATIKALLQDARVNITISWTAAETSNDTVINHTPNINELQKYATISNYALLNAQRKEELHTKG